MPRLGLETNSEQCHCVLVGSTPGARSYPQKSMRRGRLKLSMQRYQAWHLDHRCSGHCPSAFLLFVPFRASRPLFVCFAGVVRTFFALSCERGRPDSLLQVGRVQGCIVGGEFHAAGLRQPSWLLDERIRPSQILSRGGFIDRHYFHLIILLYASHDDGDNLSKLEEHLCVGAEEGGSRVGEIVIPKIDKKKLIEAVDHDVSWFDILGLAMRYSAFAIK
jgi:hypothetical protein